jgi:hypothetical protein
MDNATEPGARQSRQKARSTRELLEIEADLTKRGDGLLMRN